MTTSGSSYDKTGRFLGIGDGYFLYGESPNWVYCYCQSCWQKNILTLSFIPNGQQYSALQEQNTSLQQQLRTSQIQLSSAQTEAASYKKQLEELSEKYNQLSSISGIEKLRDLLKTLTTSQVDALHTHTKFRVDTFETVHKEQQIQCSSQFVQSTLTQLNSSVDAVIQLQRNMLTQRKQTKESVFQTLTAGGVPKTIIEASINPLEIEIQEIEAGIEGWSAFCAILANTINQSIADQQTITCEARNEC